MSMANELRQIEPSDMRTLHSVPTSSMAGGEELQAAAAPLCPACGGSGYYKKTVPFGHPHFGVLFPCECKQREQAAKLKDILLERSNIGELRTKTLDSYNRYVPGVGEAYRAALAFAKEPRGWLTLHGGYGVGKTHLLAAITNALLERNDERYEAYLGVTPDLLDHLRATFGPNSEVRYDELFDRVRNVPVLLLDDLGTEASSPWAREKLFQIVNYRYNNGLPLVVSTNVALAAIEGRIESRLSDRTLGRIIHIEADDYRKREVKPQKGTAA